MNKKELKAIAQKIADLETKRANAETKEARRVFEDEIFRVSSRVQSFDDMMALDIMIQEILEK